LGQEHRRAKAAMADDEIGRQVGGRRARLVDSMGMPNRVLESPAEIVRRLASASAGLVLDLAHPLPHSGWRLRHEVALPAARTDQVPGDVAELGWKILMDEQDPHR